MSHLGFGVVEGFYGLAWTHAARLSMVRFLAEVGLDTYLRAPKNDPDGVARPRHRLTDRARAELEELFALGNELHVRVGVAVAGDRVEEVARLGCRTFLIGFDDTWATFLRAAATFERGRRHGETALRALRAAREIDDHAEVLLVPAVYHRNADAMSNAALAYLRGVASAAREIPVAWTGPNVFSRMIRPGDVRALEEATGLSFWIWNNAIANDWLPIVTGEPLGLRATNKLSFGPVENLAPGIERASRGVIVNGAREPELTKITLATLAAFERDPTSYDARGEHRAAIDRCVGDEGAPIVRAAYEWTQSHALSSPARFEASELDDLVSGYLRGRVGRARVDHALDAIIVVDEKARRLAHTSPAVREVLPTLEHAALLAEVGHLALARLESHDRAEQKALSAKLSARLAEARRIRWRVGLTAILALVDARAGSRAR